MEEVIRKIKVHTINYLVPLFVSHFDISEPRRKTIESLYYSGLIGGFMRATYKAGLMIILRINA